MHKQCGESRTVKATSGDIKKFIVLEDKKADNRMEECPLVLISIINPNVECVSIVVSKKDLIEALQST